MTTTPMKTAVDTSPEAVAGDLTVLGAVCDEQRRRCNFATAKHVEDATALIDALRTALTASEKDVEVWKANSRVLELQLAASEKRVEEALDTAIRYGQIDGAHHKTWVIDQVVRTLLGDKYDATIAESNAGEDGPNTYTWDTGIAP